MVRVASGFVPPALFTFVSVVPDDRLSPSMPGLVAPGSVIYGVTFTLVPHAITLYTSALGFGTQAPAGFRPALLVEII